MKSESYSDSISELESQSGSSQRTKVEMEEPPPERISSINLMTEKKGDSGIAGEAPKILRFPLVKWKIQEGDYSDELQGYLTSYEFTKRVEKFNAFTRKFYINQMIMISPWMLVSLLLIISILAIEHTGEVAQLEKIVCYVFLVGIVFGVFTYYWFILRKGRQQVKHLNNLLEEFNERDIPKKIKWKLTKFDSKMCLAIELSPLIMYQKHVSIREPSPAITIHDSDGEFHGEKNDKDKNDKDDNIVNISNIRGSVESINSIDIDNIQIRKAVKTKYFYSAMPKIPPSVYYDGTEKNRFTYNENSTSSDNAVSGNAVNENSYSPEPWYYDAK